MEKVKSYAITLRPRDGITDEQIEKVTKYIKRKCDYYMIVTEKTMAERHIHAGLFLKKPSTRSNLNTELVRLFPDCDSNEKEIMRRGTKFMYNIDWVNGYTQKNEDGKTVIIASNLPEKACMEAYFPPKPEEPAKKKQKMCSLYYHELERMWYEHRTPDYEVHTINVRDFLFEMMYDKRCLTVIRDDRQIIQVARHLTRWLNKATTSTIQLPEFEKEE